MRDIKVVGYGKVSVADELAIGTALEELGIDRVQIYSVNTALQAANETIASQKDAIRALEELLEDATKEEPDG